MPVYSRKQLSAAVNGLVGLSATSAANADTIHQVQATSTAALESVWLSLRNRNTGDALIFVTKDSATATGIAMKIFLGGRLSIDNFVDLFKGLPLTGTDSIIRAYWATATNSGNVTFEGYYNQIATG